MNLNKATPFLIQTEENKANLQFSETSFPPGHRLLSPPRSPIFSSPAPSTFTPFTTSSIPPKCCSAGKNSGSGLRSLSGDTLPLGSLVNIARLRTFSSPSSALSYSGLDSLELYSYPLSLSFLRQNPLLLSPLPSRLHAGGLYPPAEASSETESLSSSSSSLTRSSLARSSLRNPAECVDG